jgi:hypothetical protein
MSDKVEVNDEVCATGQNARFVVVGFNGGMAVLQQFADEKATGVRVYFERTIEVPVGALTVFGKNHQKPVIHKVVRI